MNDDSNTMVVALTRRRCIVLDKWKDMDVLVLNTLQYLDVPTLYDEVSDHIWKDIQESIVFEYQKGKGSHFPNSARLEYEW